MKREILRDTYPVMSMSWSYWAEPGDQRHKPHAVRVLTTPDGKVGTHFARPYTHSELEAISEFERIHGC